ncbi:MAG: DNA-directed RNA polymerase subunit alpha [Planctomycetes bacterium]|nr:DNA-directed RNA polymerase subunit alpha [Planctomycetota bacterium]MBL7007745.1 DNA-directed RNA polymerase subunit alpha [Planctomycetota bacterium]
MRIRWRDFELPSGVVMDRDSATATYGRFGVEPFERGFGHTIGNGLRRVLLSSIEGTAVTAVEIDGVEHEFKSIAGVVEDVTDLVLALKRLLVQVDGEAPVTLNISKAGPCVVTGADVQCPTGVTVVNPDLEICNVTAADYTLEVKITVRRGRGFVAADETGEQMDEIGIIPVDAGFSPVKRVRYAIEACRVGKFTNYDRLVVEVWTDGTVRPEMALTEAAKIYRKHLNPFVQFNQPAAGVPVVHEVQAIDAAAERRRERLSSLLNEPIERLELSTRARNCLDTAGITTLGDLVHRNKDDLLAIKNLGQTVLTEIEKKLAELDLSIGMPRDEGVGV